jgi:hypothetical protein
VLTTKSVMIVRVSFMMPTTLVGLGDDLGHKKATLNS